MGGSWHGLCRGKSITVVDDGVRIALVGGRQHHVRVQVHGDGFLLVANVLGAARAKEVPAVEVWRRNRESRLVGFRFDGRGRLIAEAWVADAGLDASEFQLYLRSVAEEADRLEYALTGKDSY